MPNKKTKKAPIKNKETQRVEPATANVHFKGCHFDQSGPGSDQLAVILSIADALNKNAQALNKLANIFDSPKVMNIEIAPRP